MLRTRQSASSKRVERDVTALSGESVEPTAALGQACLFCLHGGSSSRLLVLLRANKFSVCLRPGVDPHAFRHLDRKLVAGIHVPSRDRSHSGAMGPRLSWQSRWRTYNRRHRLHVRVSALTIFAWAVLLSWLATVPACVPGLETRI